ncbi:hypothetical protein PROFUN_15090 [Planoprotostelium fungivorum]|uniref:Uncharacterized protein n=1 Tax=Planoprotostelium fungivorum TaxID=1890364 RepID=A0A2P6MXZ3_9EUKA|nr:hypothetical protein PROFUN_15090 [Planoprotostelium fungivorum]
MLVCGAIEANSTRKRTTFICRITLVLGPGSATAIGPSLPKARDQLISDAPATVIYLDHNGNGEYDQGEEISEEATRAMNFQTTVTMSKKLKEAEIVTGVDVSNKFSMRYTLAPSNQVNQAFAVDQDTVMVDLWGMPTYPTAANSSAKIAIIVLFSKSNYTEMLRLYFKNDTAKTGLSWSAARNSLMLTVPGSKSITLIPSDVPTQLSTGTVTQRALLLYTGLKEE